MKQYGVFTANSNDMEGYTKFINSINDIQIKSFYSSISPEEAQIAREAISVTEKYMTGLISIVDREYSDYINRFGLPNDLEPAIFYEEIIDSEYLTGNISFRIEFIPKLTQSNRETRQGVRDIWFTDDNIKDVIYQDKSYKAKSKTESLFKEMDKSSRVNDPVAARFAGEMLAQFYKTEYERYLNILKGTGWKEEAN